MMAAMSSPRLAMPRGARLSKTAWPGSKQTSRIQPMARSSFGSGVDAWRTDRTRPNRRQIGSQDTVANPSLSLQRHSV
jgi:hypothetical protein